MLHSDEVMIITDDVIFARMIALELARERINASVSRIMELQRNFKGLYIADADYISDKTVERLILDFADNVVLFSYSSPAVFINTQNVIWLRRPFIIAEFIIKISDKLNGKSIIPVFPALIPPVSGKLLLEGNGSIHFCGKNILLTRREYELLEYLFMNSGRYVSRDEAVTNVWNYEFTGNTNVVDVYIRYLREKIDEIVGVKLIYTVRNKGYMIK
jgi:hypothetical protein